MDFVTLFALSAILACTVSGASVRSQEAESQVTGALRIVKGAGPINVEDAPNGAQLGTGAGTIHVKSARRCVAAKTGAGDIMIDAVDGCVKATTGKGTVTVTMVDVVVLLPASRATAVKSYEPLATVVVFQETA